MDVWSRILLAALVALTAFNTTGLFVIAKHIGIIEAFVSR